MKLSSKLSLKLGSKSGSLLLAMCFCVLSGCATVPAGTERSSVDPFEKMNRATSTFNETFDENLLQPVARAYVNVFPGFVQTGIGNFFGNISDVWSTVNNFLQGNVEQGLSGVARVSLNSTFGLLGLLDFASEAKINKNRTDFGQTLGVWGVPNGPYLVLPFLGPSVVRETAALPIDYAGDLWSYYEPASIRNIGSVLRVVDKRASYLDAYSLLEDAALDKYIFIRDAYLQRLASQIESRKNANKDREDELEMQKREDEDAAKELQVITPAPAQTESTTVQPK